MNCWPRVAPASAALTGCGGGGRDSNNNNNVGATTTTKTGALISLPTLS